MAPIPKSSADILASQIVAFAVHNDFPDEATSATPLTPSSLAGALEALSAAKADLETEIHGINTETAPDVASWVEGAKQLQQDIVRSRQLANEIIQDAEEPEATGETIEEAEERLRFLRREVVYSQEVTRALEGLRDAHGFLEAVQTSISSGKVLEALDGLAKAEGILDGVADATGTDGIGGCRAVRLLGMKAQDLRSEAHDELDQAWVRLVSFDKSQHRLQIERPPAGAALSLDDALAASRIYREVDERMAKFWEQLDADIVRPRMALGKPNLPRLVIEQDHSIVLSGTSEPVIQSLFNDLTTLFAYLADQLPNDLCEPLSGLMVPVVVARIISTWLDHVIPTDLDKLNQFEAIISSSKDFCGKLGELGYSGFDELQIWADDAPKVWLAKCRENALSSVRSRLSGGLGTPKHVERVEKQEVSMAEGKQIAAGTNAMADDEDWGAAWGEDGDAEEAAQDVSVIPESTSSAKAAPPSTDDHEDGADAWGWGEDEGGANGQEALAEDSAQRETAEIDPSEAWGWGDEDHTGAPATQQRVSPHAATSPDHRKTQTREMTLKEVYTISAMPDPVLQLIYSILEDGAALTQASESNPVATAAAGLFSLPTLALAMFRAVSPYYYALDIGGNMYLYNDTIYLAEQLASFAKNWKNRTDLSKRAIMMLRLDNDVKTLRSFSTRAYSNEMNIQKTVLRDLLGGEQSLMQQDELESCVDAAVARIRSLAVTWESILARSAWYQAVGALIDSISTKIITDVMDASGISSDDAFKIAQLIVTITELDDLFLPSRIAGNGIGAAQSAQASKEIPLTGQYAPSWLRLQYLSEFLQSNLRDVKFMWMESELSLYFTLQEVVELVNLSFEDNARTREVLREIQNNPHPMEGKA